MDLQEYINAKKSSVREIAAKTQQGTAYVEAVLEGKLKPSKSAALEIEKATDGQVKAEDLRNFKYQRDGNGRRFS